MDGVVATAGRWLPVSGAPLVALHDRYPSQRRTARFAAIQSERQGVPMGNPLELTLLCRDKLACQRVLQAAGVPMPEVVDDPDAFQGALSRWGSGFIKPRFGALGTNVRRVQPGDVLPSTLEGVVPGRAEPTLLQRAVLPSAGFAGRALRVLCQRAPDGGWVQCPAVLRESRTDPVVNVARGAVVRVAADVLPDQTRDAIGTACATVCMALGEQPEGDWLVEVGIDLVLDADLAPHVIEVNSRPRGRLEVLAELDPTRFGTAHVQACGRPLRRLATLAG
jgi:glutathione synthase/RimK-type ligase-like ATP-grasp enzyme